MVFVSNFFHLAKSFWGPSMLWQLSEFYVLWLNNTPCTHTILYWSTHQLMNIWVFFTFVLFLSNAVMNIHVQDFMWTYIFNSLDISFRSRRGFLYEEYFEDLPNCFPKQVYHSTFPSAVYEGSISPHLHQHILSFWF